MIRLLSILLLTFSSWAIASVEPPPAEDVFQFHASTYDPNTILFQWSIKPGFFLYQKKIQLDAPHVEEKYVEIMPLKLPKALDKRDARGNLFKIYRNQLRIPVHIIGLHSGETDIQMKYQGCSDEGFCYPPITITLRLKINQQLALIEITPVSLENASTPDTAHQIRNILDHPFATHWFLTLIIFLILGLLLSFTPCVFPMIPVLSGIIVGRGTALSTKHAFLLSLSYVLSMSITYAFVGALIAKMGHNLQLLMQTPFFIGSLSLFFVILALAMFNVYELKIPTAWQAKLAKISYHQARGHYIGAIIMGCLSTLILSPCVTAPLMGALAYIANTGNTLLGISALFFLGLGMGIPLLLIGTSLGKWLPKAGMWMNDIKGLFGIILIGVAIDLSSRIMPAIISMIFWSLLFIFTALYLGLLRRAKNNLNRLKQGVAILCFVYGLLILIGISQGHTNPWQPLISSTPVTHSSLTVTSIHDMNRALESSKNLHRPVLIDFYADWCRSCKILEREIQENSEIQDLLEKITMIKADLTANDGNSQQLSQKFNIVAPPSFVYISQSGEIIDALKQTGEISVDTLIMTLKQLLEAL